MGSGSTSGTYSDDGTSQLARRGSSLDAKSDYLFLAMDCERPLDPPARYCLDRIEEVEIGRARERRFECSNTGEARIGRLGIPDRWMSRVHTRLRRVSGQWVVEDAGSKNGTVVNGVRVVKATEVRDGAVLQLGHTVFLLASRASLGPSAPSAFDGSDLATSAPGFATLQPDFAGQLDQLRLLASSGVSVIFRGESGTGKEVLASGLHGLSGRPGRFIAVNCGAIPSGLVEAELFGYRKGAFTGAQEDRKGLISAAEGGTLFLDEIGDLPLSAQPALLRVLQEGQVLPVGTTKPVNVDFRVLAATHRDLEEMAERQTFRSDLLARISGFTIHLPPLRRRLEDLGLLAASLLQRHLGAQAKSVRLSSEAGYALFSHSWPLNIRELEKSLVAAAVLARQEPIGRNHLQFAAAAHASETPQSQGLSKVQAQHREVVVAALRDHGGNITATARALGKARTQLQRWIRSYRIDVRDFRH